MLEGEPISDFNERLVLAKLLNIGTTRLKALGRAKGHAALEHTPRMELRSPPPMGAALRPNRDPKARQRAAALADCWVGKQRHLVNACMKVVKRRLYALIAMQRRLRDRSLQTSIKAAGKSSPKRTLSRRGHQHGTGKRPRSRK